MRPSQVSTALKRSLRLKIPTMVHGSPGIGKSDLVRQAAKAEGFVEVIDLRMSQLDQVDIRGVPSVVDGVTKWNPPEFLPKDDGKPRVLFLDELNSASAGVMAAGYELILDRRVGPYKLPDEVAIIAAGNKMTDFAMVNAMPSALKNRMAHLNMDVNNDDWIEWAITQGGIHESIIAYLRFQPTMLNEFDTVNGTSESKQKARNLREAQAFATPRAWAMMSKVVHDKVEPDIEYETYCGIVGEAAAAAYTGFQKHYRDLPNLDDIFMRPTKVKVPTEPGTLYALSTGLAVRATADNFERLLQYLDRIPKEFQVLCVRDANMRCSDISFTKAFTEWAVKNSDLIA